MTRRVEYEYHKAANIFPLMDGEEYEALKRDIEQNGLREPIWLYGDYIIDGRNRYRACVDLGIEPKTREWDGPEDELISFVVSLNLHRRHLNESQRALIAARVANMVEGRPRKTAPNGAVSQEGAGELLGVSRRGVQRAKKVLDTAAPEVVDAIERGDVAVSAATKITNRPHEEQRDIVGRVQRGEARNPQQAARKLDEDKRLAVTAVESSGSGVHVNVADAVEWLAGVDGAHCCIMDPPYGLDTHRTRQGGHDYADGEDYALGLLGAVCGKLPAAMVPGAHVYVFTGYSHLAAFKGVLAEHLDVQDNPLVWVKDNHTMCDFSKWYASRHEYVLFAKVPGGRRDLGKGHVSDVFEFGRTRETTHSAEKPVGLLREFVRRSTVAGELVIDPFCGGGSTLVAAVMEGREAAGVDIDTRWVEVARARCADV